MNEIQADEAGYERGWEQAEDYWRAKEQDRIIELLEALIDTRPTEVNGGWRGYSLERVINLVKGEQK